MTDTRCKLEEAKYFLGQMEDTVWNPMTFAYNLSAFLSAARSVIFFMQKEFQHFSRFDKWYKNKREEMKNYDYEFFKDLRNETMHRRPVLPTRSPFAEFFVNGVSIGTNVISPKNKGVTEIIHSKNVSVIIDEDNNIVPRQSTMSPHESKVTAHLPYYVEGKKEDIVKLCSKHIANLEKLVDECEKRFYV